MNMMSSCRQCWREHKEQTGEAARRQLEGAATNWKTSGKLAGAGEGVTEYFWKHGMGWQDGESTLLAERDILGLWTGIGMWHLFSRVPS